MFTPWRYKEIQGYYWRCKEKQRDLLILNRFDIVKMTLRLLNAEHKFEVADREMGQQIAFYERILDDCSIPGHYLNIYQVFMKQLFSMVISRRHHVSRESWRKNIF